MIYYQTQVKSNSVMETIETLRAKVEDLTPVKEEIGNTLRELVRLTFVDGTSPDGRRWVPLVFREGEPLRDNSRMMNSIEHVVTGDEIEVGTNFRFAHVHQQGMTIKPKRGKFLVFTPRGFTHPIFARKVTIPARKFLPEGELPRAWADEVVAITDDYMTVK